MAEFHRLVAAGKNAGIRKAKVEQRRAFALINPENSWGRVEYPF